MKKLYDIPVKKTFWRWYKEDLELFDRLCQLNGLTHADMLREMLRVYPQVNAQTSRKK